MSESMGLETLIFLILMKHTPQSSAIAPASPKAPTVGALITDLLSGCRLMTRFVRSDTSLFIVLPIKHQRSLST